MKKRTVQETIEFINENVSRHLNEISARKALDVYNKYDYTVNNSRSRQKERMMSSILDRAPLKVEFSGNCLSRVKAIFAIPGKSPANYDYSSTIKRGIRIFSDISGLSIETNESHSSLGLNRKIKEKFTEVDPIMNLNIPVDIFNTFTIFVKNSDNTYTEVHRDLLYNIVNFLGDGSLNNDFLDFFKYTKRHGFLHNYDMMFESSSDSRKYVKFICDLTSIAWGIDLSKGLDWHNYLA